MLGRQGMRVIEGKTALVTGAASGIGRATALALAREGAQLVLADINADALSETAREVGGLSRCVMAERVDVSNREAMASFAGQVHAAVPAIDVLVNNAGVYLTGGLLDLSLEDWDWCLSTNLWGVIHGAHFFVPGMVKRGAGGHVVNVCSMYGYWPSPGVIGYLTAKFGVFGFSEALREDLRKHGIGVSTVCPGVVRTNLLKTMRLRNEGEAPAIQERLEETYRHRDYGPEHVARAIVKAIRRNRKIVMVSPEARIMYQIERFCPPLSRLIARNAAKRMFST